MAVADLTRYYSTALDQHLADPLGLIPLAIFDFLCIYTFQDGNGRMSRLFNLLLLYHFDYAVGHCISLERIFEDTKEGYTRRWKQAYRAGTKGNTTSSSGSTTSGELCCGPTASFKSVSAPLGAFEVAKATGFAQKFWIDPCRFLFRRSRKPAQASAGIW